MNKRKGTTNYIDVSTDNKTFCLVCVEHHSNPKPVGNLIKCTFFSNVEGKQQRLLCQNCTSDDSDFDYKLSSIKKQLNILIFGV